jgi:methyl-accepting chemotaxis protein
MTSETTPNQLAALKQATDTFYSRFVRVGALIIGALGLFVVVFGLVQKVPSSIASGLGAVVVNATAYALTFRGGGLMGRRIFVFGLIAVVLAAGVFSEIGPSFAAYVAVASVTVTLAGFTLPRVDALVSCAASVATVALVIVKMVLADGWHPDLVSTYATCVGFVVVQSVAVMLFTGHTRENQGKLHAYVEDVDRVMQHARRIAKGDLTSAVDGDSEVSEMIHVMLVGLRTMVTRTRDAAAALASSAQEIAAMARQQEQGAVEQASAVTQVHKTLATLLAGSSQAAQNTDDVFRNVELTQKTTEVVAQRAAALSAHTRRISALLEIIKSIANKSEILALNAALEGARAGEAGRGFSLVASQMQRLAESVMDSIRDVRTLVEDIDAATAATLAATEESTQLSAKATAAARQISVRLQQQRGSTEQVAAAMQDIQQVTTQVSAGSTQSLSATRDLTRLAEELKRAIEGFQV